MKILKNHRTNEWQRVISLLFILFFVRAYSQNASNYPLNDPRNPNCPCHKLQQLAEEEYKNLLANASKPVKLNSDERSDKENQRSFRNNIQQSHIQIPNEPIEQGVSSFEKEQVQFMQNIDQHFIPANNSNDEKGISFSDPSRSSHGISSGSNLKKKHNNSHARYKHKKRSCRYNKWKSRLDFHNWDFLKEARVVSKCYHWK